MGTRVAVSPVCLFSAPVAACLPQASVRLAWITGCFHDITAQRPLEASFPGPVKSHSTCHGSLVLLASGLSPPFQPFYPQSTSITLFLPTGVLIHPGVSLLPSLGLYCPPFLGCTLSSSHPSLPVQTWPFFKARFKSTQLLPPHIPPPG